MPLERRMVREVLSAILAAGLVDCGERWGGRLYAWNCCAVWGGDALNCVRGKMAGGDVAADGERLS